MRELIGEKIGSVKSRAEYSILPDRVSDKIVFRITQFEDRRFQSMLCFAQIDFLILPHVSTLTVLRKTLGLV